MPVPYKCPSKRETGKVYDNSTNCLGRVYSLFSNREKISLNYLSIKTLDLGERRTGGGSE